MSRKDIKAKIKFQLVARAAGRCEFPGCNKALYEDELTKGPGNISNCAHIIPYAEDGPRGKETKHERPADINSAENLILLCPEHHKLIDSSSSEYPARELRKYKREHEERMALATEIQLERRAYIVRYTVPIAQNIPSVNIDEARLAMLPDLLYPASREPVDLSLDSISPFSDNASYEEAVENYAANFVCQFSRS